MKIEQTTTATITALQGRLESEVAQSKCLEDAAQRLAAALYTQFEESVVIARVFFTVPFDLLPQSTKDFVKKLAESAGAASQLKPTTPVLSLLGTHGQQAEWNDRRRSKGHMGIPLISSSFVGTIPMIARLLKDLGVPLNWVDSHDSEILENVMGSSSELFFVDNAAETTDHRGRKIIAAQDFVSSYKVKSVFGAGGGYGDGRMLVMVVFCRGLFGRAVAERFLPLADWFKSTTSARFGTATIFAEAA